MIFLGGLELFLFSAYPLQLFKPLLEKGGITISSLKGSLLGGIEIENFENLTGDFHLTLKDFVLQIDFWKLLKNKTLQIKLLSAKEAIIDNLSLPGPLLEKETPLLFSYLSMLFPHISFLNKIEINKIRYTSIGNLFEINSLLVQDVSWADKEILHTSLFQLESSFLNLSSEDLKISLLGNMDFKKCNLALHPSLIPGLKKTILLTLKGNLNLSKPENSNFELATANKELLITKIENRLEILLNDFVPNEYFKTKTPIESISVLLRSKIDFNNPSKPIQIEKIEKAELKLRTENFISIIPPNHIQLSKIKPTDPNQYINSSLILNHIKEKAFLLVQASNSETDWPLFFQLKLKENKFEASALPEKNEDLYSQLYYNKKFSQLDKNNATIVNWDKYLIPAQTKDRWDQKYLSELIDIENHSEDSNYFLNSLDEIKENYLLYSNNVFTNFKLFYLYKTFYQCEKVGTMSSFFLNQNQIQSPLNNFNSSNNSNPLKDLNNRSLASTPPLTATNGLSSQSFLAFMKSSVYVALAQCNENPISKKQFFEKALKEDPNNPEVKYKLGVFFLRANNLTIAKKYFLEVLNSKENLSEVFKKKIPYQNYR